MNTNSVTTVLGVLNRESTCSVTPVRPSPGHCPPRGTTRSSCPCLRHTCPGEGCPWLCSRPTCSHPQPHRHLGNGAPHLILEASGSSAAKWTQTCCLRTLHLPPRLRASPPGSQECPLPVCILAGAGAVPSPLHPRHSTFCLLRIRPTLCMAYQALTFSKNSYLNRFSSKGLEAPWV